MKAFALIFLFALLSGASAEGADQLLSIGPRLQKSVGLYWENGIVVEYSNSKLWDGRLSFGAAILSSRLGSAFHSNAVKQEEYLLSAAAVFRQEHLIRPLVKMHLGWFHADYEVELFDALPNSSFLWSLTGGLQIRPHIPAVLELGLGYNLITGNGVSGPGTLYPLFYQITLSWVILGGGRP
ncbi:MAG: hypothetical protein ONA69_03730 [candidate division KSB1 bacterium]|nr:hypothetical protein [candidate division KSB1 bacterium]MDZ7345882.1 hypothetical protein [candidate division KSB1 bacterium]